jgi:hypothetical protein
MSNQATLRRLDEEITWCNQQIAALHVQIANAQIARRTIMGIEEADQAAAEARKAAHTNLIPGGSGRPMITVRKIREEEPKRGKKGKRRESDLGKMRNRILAILQPGDEPIASADLATHLGLPLGEVHRKPLQNALYHMRLTGMVRRDAKKRYYRPPEETMPPEAAHHGSA